MPADMLQDSRWHSPSLRLADVEHLDIGPSCTSRTTGRSLCAPALQPNIGFWGTTPYNHFGL